MGSILSSLINFWSLVPDAEAFGSPKDRLGPPVSSRAGHKVSWADVENRELPNPENRRTKSPSMVVILQI